jgi:ABC-2 type transport system permease protein
MHHVSRFTFHALNMETVPTITPGSIHSLSQPIPAWKTTLAAAVKNLQIARRYVPNLISSFVQLAMMMFFFLLMANTITFGGDGWQGITSGREMFIFFQGAILILVFQGPTLWTPAYNVSQDLYNGTLEFLYSNPGSRYAYYVGSVVADVIIHLVVFLPFYGFLVVYTKADAVTMLFILVACLMVCVTLTALGIMIALLALLWRQINSVVGILSTLFQFLAGAYLPLQSFPKALQYLAYLLPYTWGYDLIRYYSMRNTWQTILPPSQEWGVLAFYAVAYTILSRYLLKCAEQQAKKQGLHII